MIHRDDFTAPDVVGQPAEENGPPMTETKPHFLSVRIDRDADAVYQFITDPTKVSLWAHGLRSSAWQPHQTGMGQSSIGSIELCFAQQNDLGIRDVAITTPDGQIVECPMRVVGDGSGSEVVFTLHPATYSADKMEQLGALIAADLNRLRHAIERL
jgi:hypothetical protein